MKDENAKSIRNSFQKAKACWRYLLSKWMIIVIFGLTGGALGLVIALITKPKYEANLSFAIIEESSGTSGLAAIAASYGFGGLNSGNSGAFSGENLPEIIKSRRAIEQAFLTPIEIRGEKKNLIEVYLQFNKLHEKWQKSKNKELHNLKYPVGQKRDSFSRTQDSILFDIYNKIIKSGALSVARKEINVGIINVDFTSKDELFSKLFVETLMAETSRFYSDTRTSQKRQNIATMQTTADSIKLLYESSLYKSAGFSNINLNTAMPYAAVPKIKQENNAQLYAAVYTEVLTNLETLKLDLARETPLVQIIDIPRLPLKKIRIGKAMGIVLGGIIGGLLIVIYLIESFYFTRALKEE